MNECHEPTDLSKEITTRRTHKSALGKTSLLGILTVNIHATHQKWLRSKVSMVIERSGNSNINQDDQTHQAMNTRNQEMKKMANNPNEDNRANQLNPNNDAYYQSRGWDDKEDHDDYYDE